MTKLGGRQPVSPTTIFPGTRIEKIAVLVVDTQNPSESFVQYQDPVGTSILDQIGSWEYDAEITLIPGNIVETSQRRVFWVK